jgi:hypothetical protein
MGILHAVAGISALTLAGSQKNGPGFHRGPDRTSHLKSGFHAPRPSRALSLLLFAAEPSRVSARETTGRLFHGTLRNRT